MLFRSPRWDEVVYWAVDLETGGLDVRRSPILAVGMVPLRSGIIHVSEAYRSLVRPEPGSAIEAASVRAHQLVPEELERAPAPGVVLAEVARRIGEGILLVHHQSIDVSFLRRDFKRLGISWPRPTVVDTAQLLVRIARATNPHVSVSAVPLTLAAARAAYGLPSYQSHDPLGDALATAELFLVLRKVLGATTLRQLR
jgi:DNA polymerase-3 subunit epsilon